jgi:hypothetical protein
MPQFACSNCPTDLGYAVPDAGRWRWEPPLVSLRPARPATQGSLAPSGPLRGWRVGKGAWRPPGDRARKRLRAGRLLSSPERTEPTILPIPVECPNCGRVQVLDAVQR